MVRLGEVSPSIWDAVTEQMEVALTDIEFQATDILLDWRDDASKRRLDRELNVKYGIFKDIILHPAYQYSVVWIEENVRYDVLLGDPLIPMATAVIVLYMLHKRVNNSIIVLIGAFLFNVNPIYVTILLVGYHFYSKKSPRQHVKSIVTPANDWMNYTSEVTDPKDSSDEYDHVLIGNDISTLYTAALLSKNGHKCCVIQSDDGIQPEIDLNKAGFCCRPIPLQDLSINKPDKYKLFFNIISPANQRDSGITFAPVGTESTGYTHSIVRYKDSTPSIGSNGNILPLRTKLQSLLNDLSAASVLDDKDKATVAALFEELLTKNAHYIYKSSISKVGRPPSNTDDEVKGETIDGIIDGVLSKCKNHSILKDCLCAIAAYAANESVNSHDCSVYNVTTGLSRIQDGLFYPVGGYRAIEKYLAKCIRYTGGVIYRNKKINRIIIEENRAVGVEIGPATRIMSTKSVVSGLGLLHTYCNLVGPSSLPTELASCEEARPKIYVIFGLIGTSDELGLTACDYLEGESSPEKYCRIWCPSCKDPSWSSDSPKFQVVVVEFEAIEPIVECSNDPKMYKLKGTKGNKLDESREKQIIDKARNKLTELYPKCNGKDSNIHVHGPTVGGHILSSKYTKFSNFVTAKSNIDGLYFTGCDVSTAGLSGELESAFNACNSILEYNANDLTVADFSSKANIIRRTALTDLANL